MGTALRTNPPRVAAPARIGLLPRLNRIRHANAWIYSTMLVSSGLSLIASFVLSKEAVTLAAHPNASLSCDINAVISCGTVGSAWQSHVFGFPNAFLGLIAEPVVITVAVASLAGVRFPRAFMFAAQVVYALGVIFAYWLFYQSMFHIGALCPWCLLVTISTTLVFSTLTHVNIRDGNLHLPPRIQSALSTAIRANFDLMLVAIWMLALALAILLRYGDRLFA
jgi:uncharacterized membrane protein